MNLCNEQKMILSLENNPNRDEIRIVRQGIIQFNDEMLDHKSTTFAVFLRDEQRTILGGLIAWTDIESIYVDILWVDKAFRGQGYGTKILHMAEEEARKNSIIYSTLDTFSFQAEEFYLKNGYVRIGEIKNYLRDHSRIFLRKKLLTTDSIF